MSDIVTTMFFSEPDQVVFLPKPCFVWCIYIIYFIYTLDTRSSFRQVAS